MPETATQSQQVSIEDSGATSDGSSKDPPDSGGKRTTPTVRTRKRTKTGCLTCRKRRIKCGEERPVCANCTRSRRNCEGYAPRLTFRTPVALVGGEWPRNLGRMDEQNMSLAPQIHTAGPVSYFPSPASSSSTQFTAIAPRPTPRDTVSGYRTGPFGWSSTPPIQQTAFYYNPPPMAGPASAPFPLSSPPNHPPLHMLSNDAPQLMMSWPAPPSAAHHGSVDSMIASNYAAPDVTHHSRVQSAPPVQPKDEAWPIRPPSAASVASMMTTPLYAVAESDSYDTEADDLVPGPAPHLPQHDAGLMLAMAASRADQAVRAADTFLADAPDLLATYVPNFSASPLMDGPTARVFCHFITATAPFLSIFERHPVNPYALLSGRPVARAAQATWTYVLPTLALQSQTLLQAMLALASLQISRLQHSPSTAAVRHYYHALRRVARAVAIPSKRTALPTVAATLLLGHYEATTAEHAKWSSHLAGARQLFLEVDFGRTTRALQVMRAQAMTNTGPWQQSYVGSSFQPATAADLPWVPISGGTDDAMIAQLTGWGGGAQGGIFGNEQTIGPLTEKDCDDFQLYRDLFWFYCKQDIIQSCISGNALLLPFERWRHCPPRGPVGKIDAVYGTMDHLMLLLGRVCQFARRDQARKAKASAVQTDWSMPADQQAWPILEETSNEDIPTPAYGIVPGAFPSALPEAFKDGLEHQILSSDLDSTTSNIELATATAAAEIEWAAIQAALNLFESQLGAAFQPLPPDAAPQVDTPFGPALHYRTYHVATIWSYFYAAKILALRTHPSLPPQPSAAAEHTVSQTAPFAISIGRIALGLQPPPVDQPLNPSFGAALSESLLPLFYAATQYTETAQRQATMQRLRVIADRAGVASATLVAAGLERCWVVRATEGNGPPYQPEIHVSQDGSATFLGNGSVGATIEAGFIGEIPTEADNKVIYVPSAVAPASGENSGNRKAKGIMGADGEGVSLRPLY